MPEQKPVNKKYLGLKYGEILIKLKKITPEELDSILIAQKNTKTTLGEFLLQRNLITEDEQLRFLSLSIFSKASWSTLFCSVTVSISVSAVSM
ncbi:hypothetical protein ES705_16297 [subsurface metagenome]